MQRFTSMLMGILALVFISTGILMAGPSAEQIIEECVLEASKRGFDIENVDFADELAEAIVNEDEAKVKKFCPKTFIKYDD